MASPPSGRQAGLVERIDEILCAALDHPPESRRQLLEHACDGDQTLLTAVQRLLDASEGSDIFLCSCGALQGPLWQEMAAELLNDPVVPAGTQVGAYRLLRELGRGGMAVIYLAERTDGRQREQVAMKVLRCGLDSPEVTRRFEQEHQILSVFDHAAIARLLDRGVMADGRPFFTMEYVNGTSINHYCNQRQLAVKQRLEVFLAVAAAVQHAHLHLVVHRDLKPSNVMVTADGQAKLLDFGIAALLDEQAGPDESPSTPTSARIMTPEYASPEQVQGLPVSPASDTYQLGLLLYELLTNRQPYQLRRRSLAEMVQVICRQDPLPPSTVIAPSGEVLPGELDTIVLKSLRKEPEQRYATAAELSRDIERYLAGHHRERDPGVTHCAAP